MKDIRTQSGSGRIDREAALGFIRDGHWLDRGAVASRDHRRSSAHPAVNFKDPTQYPFQVQQILEATMGKMSGARRAVMFSGGFDSLLMCLLARRAGAQVTAVTVEFEDLNPRTVRTAAESARRVGVKHCILHVKTAEFLSSFEALAQLTDEPVFDLDLAVVYAALRKYDRRVAGSTFISGMGSDQWFGNDSLQIPADGCGVQLQRTITAQAAHQKVAKVCKCSFMFPFISKPMLALASSVPVSMKKHKRLLRTLPVVKDIPPLRTPRELQVPPVARHLLIQVFGRRAWPGPLAIANVPDEGGDRKLRQIVLGLWLENRRTIVVQ